MKLPPATSQLKSRDDLTQVSQLEAAEERARAALRLVEQEQREKAELQRQLEAHKAEQQRQLDAALKQASIPKTEVISVEPKPSQRPGVLTVQTKGLKVAIPLAILIPLLTGAWAMVQYVLDYQRQFKALVTTVAGYEKRFEEQTRFNAEVREDQVKLRETQAAQAGWITGAMPKAGVNVPGIGIEVKADPLPPGARRQTPVNVRTPVPTPPDK